MEREVRTGASGYRLRSCRNARQVIERSRPYPGRLSQLQHEVTAQAGVLGQLIVDQCDPLAREPRPMRLPALLGLDFVVELLLPELELLCSLAVYIKYCLDYLWLPLESLEKRLHAFPFGEILAKFVFNQPNGEITRQNRTEATCSGQIPI